MIIEIKKLSDLKPNPNNPRQSTKNDEKHLKASLNKFGVVEPVVFNKQSGFIVGGHFRVRELAKMGFKEVHCVIVDLNEQDEKELLIRLNANTGSYDYDVLANLWNTDELKEWGLNIPDFDNDEETLNNKQNDFIKISIEASNESYVQMEEKLQNLCDEFNVILKVK